MGAPVSTETCTILHDADCGFCQACADWLLPRLRAPRPRLAPLDSPAGRSLLAAHQVPAETDSVVVLLAGTALVRSDAVLALLARCRFPWNLLRFANAVPRWMRDGLYDLVARNRHRLATRGCRTDRS